MLLILSVVALLLFATGCIPDGPRELPFPTFEARAPFPELGPAAKAAERSGDDNGESSFEKAIADSMAEPQDEDEQGAAQPQTTKRQDVPLADTFVSSIPLEFDQWEWSTSGKVTLITYREKGSERPNAMIYVERFSGLMSTFPSMEVRRFQKTVDPALVSSLVPPGLSDALVDKLGEKTGLGGGKLEEALGRGTSHTMGMGLNYRSAEDTFTGWRWVGHNDQEVELRFGRSAGVWSGSAQAPQGMAGAFGKLAGQLPQLGGLQERMKQATSGGGARRGRSAWMVLGSAVAERDVGVHIAFLCQTAPHCPVADDFADFLAELRPAEGGQADALRRQSRRPDLEDFAGQQGLPFVPGDELMPPSELGSTLQEALSGP